MARDAARGRERRRCAAASRAAARRGARPARSQRSRLNPVDRRRRGRVALGSRLADEACCSFPPTSTTATTQRLRERVVPSWSALLGAALDRDRLQAEVVETQALRRSDVIKTALLRAVSHDLRTPLTAIITAGDAVRSPALADGERDELGVGGRRGGAAAVALVDKLLDLSRLQAGAAEPRRDWCSLEEVVRTAVGDVAGDDGRGFALSVRPGPAARAGRRGPARARVRQPAGERPALQRRPSGEGPRARGRRQDEHPGDRSRAAGSSAELRARRVRAVLPRRGRERASRRRAGAGDRARGSWRRTAGACTPSRCPGTARCSRIELPLAERARREGRREQRRDRTRAAGPGLRRRAADPARR